MHKEHNDTLITNQARLKLHRNNSTCGVRNEIITVHWLMPLSVIWMEQRFIWQWILSPHQVSTRQIQILPTTLALHASTSPVIKTTRINKRASTTSSFDGGLVANCIDLLALDGIRLTVDSCQAEPNLPTIELLPSLSSFIKITISNPEPAQVGSNRHGDEVFMGFLDWVCQWWRRRRHFPIAPPKLNTPMRTPSAALY